MSDPDFQGGSLCVVGNINRDLKPSPLAPDPGLFEDGETAIDALAETIGGGGANSACAAAALGARVTFFGKAGADPLGDRLERTLAGHGVQARLARDRVHPTGTSIALSFENGRRHFLSCLPASRAFSLVDMDLDRLRGHRHLLRADIWFSDEMLFEGNRVLFQTAREAGLAVSIDLNWDPEWGRSSAANIKARKEAVRAVLPWVNLAHGNVRELTEFAGGTDFGDVLKRLEDWGAEAVVAHLGAGGAGYYHRGELIVASPDRVLSKANQTGTGDVLSVCLALLHHRSAEPVLDRLRRANAIVARFMDGSLQLLPSLAS